MEYRDVIFKYNSNNLKFPYDTYQCCNHNIALTILG